MKTVFAKIFILAVMSYAMIRSYGQGGTTQVQAVDSSFKTALILVRPTEAFYRLGSPMTASITVTNISQNEILVMYTLPEFVDYRVSVASAEGIPVTGPARIGGNGLASSRQVKIEPGSSDTTKIDLAQFTHIQVAGMYYLTVARRIYYPATSGRRGSWDYGFAVSDRVTINVAK
jgi:hypothetical protein